MNASANQVTSKLVENCIFRHNRIFRHKLMYKQPIFTNKWNYIFVQMLYIVISDTLIGS